MAATVGGTLLVGIISIVKELLRKTEKDLVLAIIKKVAKILRKALYKLRTLFGDRVLNNLIDIINKIKDKFR